MQLLSVPENLKCEYVADPMGVVSQNPVLSWSARSCRRGAFQKAYRVVAASSLASLENGIYDKWDSGRVESGESAFVRYEGKALLSAERVYWMVNIWDDEGNSSGFSRPAFFEMGLLSPREWEGRWMGFLGGMIGNGILLRREFKLREAPVRARAYIAGLGYYELRLNGSKVGDKVLDPGATDFSRTILYSIYDVTPQLRAGSNVVGIILGTGWSGCPKALLQLNVEYADGSKEQIVTDWGSGWYVARGPILYNSIYDGEDYDAREEKDGWDTSEYDFNPVLQRPGGWILATIVENPGGELVPEISEPVRVTQQIKPKFVHELPDGSKIYDTGINLTGWARIQVRGEAGSRIVLKFAEVLGEDGNLDTVPLRSARCEDSYVLRGKPAGEEYAPRFTYHGFRFIHVRTEGKLELGDLTVEFVRGDLARNATFDSSDELLNLIEQAMWNTEACNMHSIPTDCCQRDERHGWVNDAGVRVESSAYHFDVSAYYEKWLRDVFETQDETGYIADTAPFRWGNRPCDPSINTPVWLPLLMYRTYGNRRILETYYDGMKRYVAAILSEAEDYIVSRYDYGEWACPKAECIPEEFGPGAAPANIDPGVTCTSFLYLDLIHMQEVCAALGRQEDRQTYAELARKVKDAYNRSFFHSDTAQYDRGTQSANTFSLMFGLVPEGYEQKVLRNIRDDIVRRDYHLSTGDQGTKQILELLSANGMEDIACRVMQQTSSPSFGYMIEHGATSMWERWEADRDNNIMNSRNQPMFASAGTWFYKWLGGIRAEAGSKAFDRLLVAPVIPETLSFAKAELHVMSGRVKSSWRKKENGLSLHAEIPFNTTAEIRVPLKNCGNPEAVLYEGDLPVDAQNLPDGIQSVEKTREFFRIKAGCGVYRFAVR